MTTRTSKKTVTFRRPFVLGGFDEVLPAGAYSVEVVSRLPPDIDRDPPAREVRSSRPYANADNRSE
jgi:hypothetical protein